MKLPYGNLFLCVLCAFAVNLYAGCTANPPATDAKDVKKNGDGEEKEFIEVIKDFKPITGGLFTIYSNPKDGRALLELKPDQFDKILLCSVTRESADGNFLDSASLQDNFPFFFRRVNKRVQLILKNVLYRADRDKPAFRALETGISDSMISSSVVLSKPHPDTGAVLASLNDLFLIDRYNLAHHLSERTKADFSFDRENSYFSILKTFPENMDIEINMHFRSTKPVSSPTLADGRSFFTRYYYSITTLPKDDYQPRLADDRVGHFLTIYADYTSMKTETPYVRYVNRWHLEKADPDAPLAPPKKPIVFWLDKNIPLEYRESIKQGALLWNKAFEKIGFKDALVVYQQPDDADWDPADVRYNVIRWMVAPSYGYAVGPSHDDPFTGELYTADIRISADMVRYRYVEFEYTINPLQANSAIGNLKSEICTYAQGLAQQASLGMAFLESTGFLEGNEEAAEKFTQAYLIDLVSHEVGHTLGLRHNFKASVIWSPQQLTDKSFTAEHGMTGSVMDYNPVNLAVDPARQGEFWHSTLGPYDDWAIEYAYKPVKTAVNPALMRDKTKTAEEELPELKKIAAKCGRTELAYGTDEDACGNAPRGIDPACAMWDLGNDPFDFCNNRIAIARSLWSRIETQFTKPGQGYQKMRKIFRQGLSAYSGTGMQMARLIGGIYHHRNHIADPNGRPPFEPVPAATQQQALDFIVTNIFGISEDILPPAEVLNKLAPDLMPDFYGGPYNAPSIEPQIQSAVLGVQQSVLNYIYEPTVLNRLDNINLKFGKAEAKFGLSEMFGKVFGGIWKEVIIIGPDGAWGDVPDNLTINPFRRNLQRAHLEKLISIYLTDAKNGIPSDAIALAYSNLLAIKDNTTAILTYQMPDSITKAHLQNINKRIITALELRK